jgi:hypothetical protein
VRTKDSCWSVGTIYDPRELPGVSTAGPGIGRGVTSNKPHYIRRGDYQSNQASHKKENPSCLFIQLS